MCSSILVSWWVMKFVTGRGLMCKVKLFNSTSLLIFSMHFFYCIFFHLIIPSINLTRTSALILVAFTPVRFIIKAKKKCTNVKITWHSGKGYLKNVIKPTVPYGFLLRIFKALRLKCLSKANYSPLRIWIFDKFLFSIRFSLEY